MSRRKRKICLNFQDELNIIKSLKDGESISGLAEKYKVSQSKIYSIKQHQNNLLKLMQQSENQDLGYLMEINSCQVKKIQERNSLSECNLDSNTKVNSNQVEKSSLLPLVTENGKLSESSSIKEDNEMGGSILLVSDPPSLSGDHVESQDKATLILSSDPLVKMEELLSLQESSENVLCTTYEKFQETLSNFETDTYTKYIITKTKGPFVENDIPFVQRRVRWWKGGKLMGVPYIVIASRYYSCRYGAATHSKVLEEYAKKREEQHKLGLCKRYKKVKGSKKVGCPVKFTANRLLIFPELQVLSNDDSSTNEKDLIMRNLKRDFSSFCYESRYTCILPDMEKHQKHSMGRQAANEPMDDRILRKIKELVAIGKTDPDDVAETLEDFAKLELKVDDRDRRKFFPKRLDIMNAINRAKLKIRFNLQEQEAITSMSSSWGSSDEVFLRPLKSSSKDGHLQKGEFERPNNFLFVYQNQEMKRLFRLYGGNTILLDAIHRHCEYVWPFYLLVVNTNSSYQVVGLLVTQHDSKTRIADALQIIKFWNPGVSPEFALVNRPWEEIKALETVYPTVRVFVSSFHRDWAWRKKIARRENDGIDRLEVLLRLQQVAEASSENDLRIALSQLKDSQSYNSSTMKIYYESTWQVQLKRWVSIHKPPEMLFDINDGIHRLMDDIQYDRLAELKNRPLSTIINTYVTHYIPTNLRSYSCSNAKLLRKYAVNTGIPLYLKNCSQWIFDQVLIAHLEATEESEQYFVQYMSDNSFIISYMDVNRFYEVGFQPLKRRVTCTCSPFPSKILCKHIIIVGLKFSEWHLLRISGWLFDNPLYRVDRDYPGSQDEVDLFHMLMKTDLRATETTNALQHCEDIKEVQLNSKLEKGDFANYFMDNDITEVEEMVIEIGKVQ